MTRITRDMLDSYVHCKFKGYLKLIGQEGTRSDYEIMLAQLRRAVRCDVMDRIHIQAQGDCVPSNVALTTPAFERGPLFALDVIVEDDDIDVCFDGLKRVPGVSKFGSFLYVPMLFHEGIRIGNEQRLQMELYGLLLGRCQGAVPNFGIVWHSSQRKATTIRFSPDLVLQR